MLIPSEKRLLGLGQNKVRQSTLCKSGICGILVHGMATFNLRALAILVLLDKTGTRTWNVLLVIEKFSQQMPINVKL